VQNLQILSSEDLHHTRPASTMVGNCPNGLRSSACKKGGFRGGVDKKKKPYDSRRTLKGPKGRHPRGVDTKHRITLTNIDRKKKKESEGGERQKYAQHEGLKTLEGQGHLKLRMYVESKLTHPAKSRRRGQHRKALFRERSRL